MKQAFTYTDGKSRKFWIIDPAGSNIMVNFGKLGTAGRYQITEYGSEAECQKAAAKLITQKTKKGYRPAPDFDFAARLYFDDEEFGPHPKTSHPNFVRHFADSIYYDCGDEEAPFGSDEGSDTLYELAQAFRKNPDLDTAAFPQKLICQYWGMDYLPPAAGQTADSIATAFGSIKISGSLHPELHRLALLAIQRLDLLAQLRGWHTASMPSETGHQMADDLQRFAADNLKCPDIPK